MYSYADRLRAVELYVRLGKGLNATIRQLGYPTKNALKGCVAEVDAYIRWYNEKGIKKSLGSLSPVEYRQSLGLNL